VRHRVQVWPDHSSSSVTTYAEIGLLPLPRLMIRHFHARRRGRLQTNDILLKKINRSAAAVIFVQLNTCACTIPRCLGSSGGTPSQTPTWGMILRCSLLQRTVSALDIGPERGFVLHSAFVMHVM